MKETILHLLLMLSGGFLIWLGAWNYSREDPDDKEASNAKYVIWMIAGLLSALAGLLYLLQDIIELF